MNGGKFCLISAESRRSLDFTYISRYVNLLASFGYYFDRVSRIAYDSTEEIRAALVGAKSDYTDIFVLCPLSMAQTITDFYSGLYGARFDGLGIMSCGAATVFVIPFTDRRISDDDIKNTLGTKYGVIYGREYIRACAPYSEVCKAVSEALEGCESCGVTINVKSCNCDSALEILYTSATPKLFLDVVLRKLVSALSDSVYALENISLSEQLYRLLKLRRMKIAVAESFTGGGMAKALVSVSGISEVYTEGLNTYSNESKAARLGVKELTLKQYGAVSAETAYEMAAGLLAAGSCDIAISTTGIAGPKSDNTQKPVGLAYIGIGVKDDIAVYKFNFEGDRETITNTAINRALFLAYKRLK